MDKQRLLEGCSIRELYGVMEALDMGSYDSENKADMISLILAWSNDKNLSEIIDKIREE